MRLLGATVALILLPALAQAFGGKPVPAEAPAPRPVVTEIVSDREVRERSVPGVIAARVEVNLGFQTLGRVIERLVDVGDVVVKDDLLASLDPDDLRGKVTAAEASVSAASVQLQTARATAERTRELVRRGVASTAQLEQSENALAAAEAALRQASSELARAEDAEGYASMTAPFSGVISAVFVNAGTVVSAGEPVVRLSGQDQPEAVIDLPETALSSIAVGSGFKVWSETEPEEIVPATVRLIEPMADAATRTRRVHLTVGPEASFRLGTLIRARPDTGEGAVLSIPIDAILSASGQDKVWVVATKDNQRRVSLRDVTITGSTLDGHVTVSKGLQSGEEIVIRGVHSLQEGQPVGRSVTP